MYATGYRASAFNYFNGVYHHDDSANHDPGIQRCCPIIFGFAPFGPSDLSGLRWYLQPTRIHHRWPIGLFPGNHAGGHRVNTGTAECDGTLGRSIGQLEFVPRLMLYL